MAGDIIGYVNEFDIESPEFADRFFYQVVARDLTEAAIINVSQNSGLQMIAGVNLDDRPLDKRFPAAVLTQLRGGETRVITDAGDRVEAVLRLDPEEERSEEHTSELQSLMRTSYAVFCLKKNRAKQPS